MKLVSITFGTVPRMPGLRPAETAHIDCDKPGDALKDWRVAIRGQQVFFISPPGWDRDRSARRDPKGAITVFEVPRTEMFFQWRGDTEEIETILKSGKFESPPFGWQPTPVASDKPIIEQIPANQIGD